MRVLAFLVPLAAGAAEFPPESAGREISGELIAVDHVNRKGTLRLDRTEAQQNHEYDLPLPFTLLPYGKVMYRGAYADLRHVPIGTHLTGLFFARDAKSPKPVFDGALRLEDDFSRLTRLKKTWRVDAVELEKQRLVVTGVVEGGPADAKPTILRVVPATRVWKGRTIGGLKDLAPGQKVLANLTECTLWGPGRCLDVWIDEESRALARDQQLETHKQDQRLRGLAAWIDDVDNKNEIVTATIFDHVDPSLLKDLRVKNHVAAAVAEESLRTYDQGNDKRFGPVLEIKSVPAVPGCSGVRLSLVMHLIPDLQLIREAAARPGAPPVDVDEERFFTVPERIGDYSCADF